MTKINTILFDFGKVLIEWNPEPLLEELSASFSRDVSEVKVLLWEWIQVWDRGSLRDLLPQTMAAYPAYADLMRAYCDRWIETIGQPIDGTVEIVKRLKKEGYKLYGASNWETDKFELVRDRLTFLDLFDGVQISGYVGLVKPNADFFERLMTDYHFSADSALFIDDRLDNVQAARALGMNAILFQSPQQLEKELNSMLVF